ncbi:MAG: ankyrin repeat domain-containing protein [Campylobacterota bacterium]|nr:ankyrin repeat domain-containing protein [Campylobacterota bacterium]
MTQIESLLINGADANTKDHKGFTLLMKYMSLNDLPSVKALVSYGASVNYKDFLGYTAIDYGINNNAIDCIKYLIENGAVITSDSYMLAVNKNKKMIVNFFDTLDPDKHIFLKKRTK